VKFNGGQRLEEFFKRLKKSKALRKERAHGEITRFGGSSSWAFRVPFGHNLGTRNRK
jgi:hypothetical protein